MMVRSRAFVVNKTIFKNANNINPAKGDNAVKGTAMFPLFDLVNHWPAGKALRAQHGIVIQAYIEKSYILAD
jgi:hypothetical protein